VGSGLKEVGPDRLRKIAIWDGDWKQMAKDCGVDSTCFGDPRSTLEKLIHRLLKATQSSRERITVRAFEFMLRKMGW
jgi:hypothetical protein